MHFDPTSKTKATHLATRIHCSSSLEFHLLFSFIFQKNMEKSHPFSENGNRLPSPPPDTQTGAKLVDNVGGAENDSIQIIFLGDLPAELQCKKCGQILRFPQKLDCGHRFCASCIAGLHTCPQCSALIDSSKVCD